MKQISVEGAQSGVSRTILTGPEKDGCPCPRLRLSDVPRQYLAVERPCYLCREEVMDLVSNAGRDAAHPLQRMSQPVVCALQLGVSRKRSAR